MSWFTPILLTVNERSNGACPPRAAEAYGETYGAGTISDGAAAARPQRGAGRGAALGSAWASDQWAWSAERAQTTAVAPAPASAHAASARLSTQPITQPSAQKGVSLHVPVEALRQMSEAAHRQGRSESEVWVEAAREWLRRREGEPGAPPATAAPEVAARPIVAPRRIARLWDDIDALLIELRAPASAAAPEREGAPAA